jgi:hypothetical protein
MKFRNVFKTITRKNQRIEYTDLIKSAVLNPAIGGLCLNINMGYDWIDTKYGFIKLLLQRGQIKHIKSGSDLLARTDYLEALTCKNFVSVALEVRSTPRIDSPLCDSPKFCSYASEKRILNARARLYDHVFNFKLEAV